MVQEPTAGKELKPESELVDDEPEDVPELYESSDDESSDDESDEEGAIKSGEAKYPGLKAPTLTTGERINGKNKRQLKKENKARRLEKQVQQQEQTYWSKYKGEKKLPAAKEGPKKWKGQMCPQGLALHHPAAETLLEYATGGCPANTGRPWTYEEMEEAVQRGPHRSALEPDAIAQLREELKEKVAAGQAEVVEWDDIKHDPPEQLKISPLAMIPHKSRKYRAILDLSFKLRLKSGEDLESQ